MIQSGVTFYQKPFYHYTVIKYFRDNLYIVKEKNLITDEVRDNILLDKQEINSALNDQENIITIVNENICQDTEFKKKMQELREQEEREEKIRKQEYENVHGFCDNMKPHQKARVLKILNKSIAYEGNIYKRKDFIHKMLKEGYRPTIIDKLLTSSKKVNGERIEKYKYNVPAISKEDIFIDITKTEYNYANYLLNKGIV